MVSVAFVMCLTIGVLRNDVNKKIKTKKQGYKANSFARNGLNIIRNAIKKINKYSDIFNTIAEEFIFVISTFFYLKNDKC
jgi:hypothetical protein